MKRNRNPPTLENRFRKSPLRPSKTSLHFCVIIYQKVIKKYDCKQYFRNTGRAIIVSVDR